MYLTHPEEELEQPCILQDHLHCAQEQNWVHRICLRQLVRHRSVQICMCIPLIPVEEVWRRPTILNVLSGVSFYVQATWGEANILQKWVSLYSLLTFVKLYQWKSCRQHKQPVTTFDLHMRGVLHHFQQECHLKLWWRKFSLGRGCIVIFGADNKYPLLLMHSILLARSILL